MNFTAILLNTSFARLWRRVSSWQSPPLIVSIMISLKIDFSNTVTFKFIRQIAKHFVKKSNYYTERILQKEKKKEKNKIIFLIR